MIINQRTTGKAADTVKIDLMELRPQELTAIFYALKMYDGSEAEKEHSPGYHTMNMLETIARHMNSMPGHDNENGRG